jgi:hypothetical protein
MMEATVFDPEEIAVQLGRNLPHGLRMIADAVEAKQIDGRLLHCGGYGLSLGSRDTRAHILVKLDLAAEPRVFRKVEPVPALGEGAKELSS